MEGLASLTLVGLPLLLCPLCFQAAWAQTYSLVDSIEVHGLVFLGKIERPTYGYTDSVECQFAVANRSQEPVRFTVSSQCDPVFAREDWCDSSGTSWHCTPVDPIFRACVGPGHPYDVTITRGEHVIAAGTFPSQRPEGDSWWFRAGRVLFFTPWPEYSPYFEFAISYNREGPTQLNDVTWSLIKAHYR